MNLDVNAQVKEGLRAAVASTNTELVAAGSGSFGGAFSLPAGYCEPVPVSSVDGVVLDAGALIGLQRGDDDTRAVLDWVTRRHYPVVVPAPVITQVHRGGHDHAGFDRIFKMAKRVVPTSEDTARRAGALLGRTGMSDAVDAIVAAEALDSAPSMILTSDPDDLVRLADRDPAGARVVVFAVQRGQSTRYS